MAKRNNIMKTLADIEDWSTLYLKGRPVWGPHLYDLESYAELRNETLKHLEALQQEGGLLVLPFDEDAERSVLIFLNILAGKLRDQGKNPFYSQFLGEPYLDAPTQSVDIWIIHNAPRFRNMHDINENWIKPGRVMLATGLSEMWERIPPRVPFFMLTYFVDKEISFNVEEEKVKEEIEGQIKTDPLMEKAYHQIALCDAWGVPLPFDLLGRLIDTDGDTLATVIEKSYQRGILFWVEREKPWALLISTRSERHARRYIKGLSEPEKKLAIEIYCNIIQKVDPEDREERFTVLKLIESWLAHSNYRRKIFKGKLGINEIRDFVQRNWSKIKIIINAGNSSEQLLWGQSLAQLGLYSKGLEVLENGLRIDPKNVYLSQAKAHLLSHWSNVEPRKQEEATQAFSKAVKVVPDNPYLWQAWGVFEAERGNREGAESYFNRALQIDPRNLCTLVARADMNLEAGFFDKASEDLEKAKSINEQNLYVQHLQGRLFFYQGKWDDAKRVWKSILNSVKLNLYALQSLGHMARVRGQWEDARSYLEKALHYDPENVPTLMEKGLLEMDTGSLVVAEKVFQEALTIEPGNPKTTVCLAVAERLQGKLEAAIERLNRLLQIWPDNVHAHHSLALCYFDHGNRDQALQHLQEIINLSQGQNLLAYFSLTEMAIKEEKLEMAKKYLESATGAYENAKMYMPTHKKIASLREIGRLLYLMEKTSEAKSVLNGVLKLDPDDKRIQRLTSELGDSA